MLRKIEENSDPLTELNKTSTRWESLLEITSSQKVNLILTISEENLYSLNDADTNFGAESTFD